MQGYGRAVLQDSQLAAYVKQYDRNQNGEVDREEVRNFLELTGGPAFQLTAMPYGYNSQPDVRELIDRDGDGAISAEELAAASDRLKSRDANDDDILDAVEISGVYGAYGGNRVLQQRNFGSRAIRTSAAHLLGPAADLVTLYESMKQRYAKDDRLTAETLPAAAQLIESLDLNKNGEFDAGETIGLHLAKPHLVLEVKLFTTPGDRPELIVKSRTESLRAVGDERAPSDTVRLAGYGAELNIQASQAMQTASYKASAERMVAQYDTDKNGYLEKKEFEGNNNAAYFTMQIDVWDADGDGKVFAAEIEADYNRRLAPTISRVAVGAGDLGVSLFGALDASGDNRLGLREMRSAAEQLKRFDKNEDGKILAEEMPSRLEVAFAIGQAALPSQNRIVLPGRGGLTPATRTAPGPKWFVHMDTNGDGDVSRREFIGPIEAFAKLDADGDGLISHEEAK
jgi:Ca2+-binding EF-hand superfamily protein